MSTVTAPEIEELQIEESGSRQQPRETIDPSAAEARINRGNVELMRLHVCYFWHIVDIVYVELPNLTSF